MSKNNYRTDFLCPRTNIWVGMGAIFNIAGNYFDFSYSSTSEEADARALESDWGMISQDIVDAIKKTSAKQLAFEFNK